MNGDSTGISKNVVSVDAKEGINMKTIRKKMSIFKHWYIWRTLPIIVLLMLFMYPCVAIAQYPEDEIPVLDLNQSQKAVVVRLNFTGNTTATLDSAEVFFGRAHGRTGGPPMLGVEVLDLNGNITEQFNVWHPLKVFVKDDAGLDKLMTRANATGSIIFPFAPNIASVTVKDKQSQSEIISVDILPYSHDFCRGNRNDADCANVVNRPPNCNAGGPYRVECAGQTTSVTLNGGGSFDPDKDPITYTWSGPFVGGTITGATPTVQFLGFGGFNANLKVSDDFGGTAACSSAVSVVDTTPPTITAVSASPNVLWPPNHKMVDVTINYSATDICSQPACRISSVTGNEPISNSDYAILDAHHVNLSADRLGSGNGRIYTIGVTCTDASGNSSNQTVNVAVPHDQSR